MEIIIAKNSGFCFGVKRAVDGANEAVKKYKGVKCLGSIVHNEQVVADLESKGMTFIKSLDEIEEGKTILFRAHGVAEEVYKEAKKKNLEVLDYTCPKVMLIHEKIKEKEADGYQIIIIGKKIHPEVIGSAGHSKNAIVIEKNEEIEDLPDFAKVFVIAQTTFSMSQYLEMEEMLKNKYENIECVNSICPSTKIRQQECSELASKVDFMIIIGGKESSNTKKLYEVAVANNPNTIIIQDENDKKIEESRKYGIIGIMSGASTPNETVDKVVEKIKEG